MSITRADWNGAYNKYRIRELTDDITFITDTPINMRGVVANKGMYNETSFVNEQNVFEDKELRAAIVQYNDDTKQLTLFDDISINGIHYRIVKIDSHTLKEYDEEFGVLQLVVIDTPFGEICCNKDEILKGVVMSARVKDKVLNSISRELVCEHNRVERGDYIKFTYDRDENNTKAIEDYIIMNNPVMNGGYDISLMYLCENQIGLLDGEGKVVYMPFYFEDNRTRIDKESDSDYAKFKNSSYMITIQDNEITEKLKFKCDRVIIKGNAYRITGFDDLTNGIINLGLEIDQINTEDDNLELGVANYYSQLEEIKGNEDSTPPTSNIYIREANGYIDLCKGYENEYFLNEVDSGISWSVDKTWAKLRVIGARCFITFDEFKYVGETITLSAKVGNDIYKLEIPCVNL